MNSTAQGPSLLILSSPPFPETRKKMSMPQTLDSPVIKQEKPSIDCLSPSPPEHHPKVPAPIFRRVLQLGLKRRESKSKTGGITVQNSSRRKSSLTMKKAGSKLGAFGSLAKSPTAQLKKMLKRSSISSKNTASSSNPEDNLPHLYRLARQCQWEDFIDVCDKSSHSDVSYVYEKDGTNALHMAIMSRTGYIKNFKANSGSDEFLPAPIEVIEKLLKIYPDGAKVRCTLNGYTPLAYACFVSSKTDFNVEKVAMLVRIILEYCPASIDIFTDDNLSPIDLHICSYSHHHHSKEEASTLGRTSTAVLRELLIRRPALANPRIRNGQVEGPMEHLYRCNASAFSEAILDDIPTDANHKDDSSRSFSDGIQLPHRRKQVIELIDKWWIWKWAILILKFGSKTQKKVGTRFSAVHAAAGQVGCPNVWLSIAVCAFPGQMAQSFASKDGVQNLPLHTICSWPTGNQDGSASKPDIIETRKTIAIARMLEEYPAGAKVINNQGETALELALKSGTTWDNGIRKLTRAHPEGVMIQSKQTRLYPFMTAASVAAASNDCSEREELQSVRTIYGLLRSKPDVLAQCLPYNRQE